ncbi:MAG: ABC transporter substrate-binding protein [Candidatus Bipolaricaulota bacterium]|nr:ABC transporter substrate-binding protein [Candidatus Bipolaricaulota bacterium]
MRVVGIVFIGSLLLGLVGVEAQRERVSLMLEFFANPTHAPIFVAKQKGFFAQEGLDVEILAPPDPSQPPSLAAAGRVDIALTNLLNHVILRATQDLPVLAFGALHRHPLGGLVAIRERGITKITDLKGKKVGFSVEPIEPALYRVMLSKSGVDPKDVELVKLDFLALLPALLAGRLDAIGAFRNFEPVRIELANLTPVFFAQEAYGAPDYYELVFIARRELIERRPETLRKFLRGIARGVFFLMADPLEAKKAFFEALPDLRDELNQRAFDRTVTSFFGAPCAAEVAKWRAAQEFLVETKIIPRGLPLETLYTDKLLPEEFFPRGCPR